MKAKLAKEFLQVGKFPQRPLAFFGAVAVLSAEEVDLTGENRERIFTGLKLAKKLKRPMIFLGTRFHNPVLRDYLKKNDPEAEVWYPADHRFSTSRTHIKSLGTILRQKRIESVLIISHAYHIPRVRRYCKQYLKNKIYDFYPVGDIKKQTAQVKREIDKIITYAKKGDITL